MSSEQPGGDGHALSPGPARRGARAEPRGLPPPRRPPPPPPPRPLTWGPRLPGQPRARPGGGRAEHKPPRAAEATCWGLEAA